MHVGLIFVLFQPGGDDLAHLERACRQAADLLVVDNTPVPDEGLHARLRDEGVRVLANQNRGGLAGAYNRGADLLLADGCELVVLLDQDSDIPDDYCARLAAAAERLAGTAYLLGPRVYEVRAERFLDAPAPEGADHGHDGLTPTSLVISSGSAFSAAAYRQLGAFREDYFIELIDVEYSRRAVTQGVAMYVVDGVVLRQTTGAITVHGAAYTTNHAAWRRYYLARNYVLTARLYSERRWSRDVFGYPVGEARLILRHERDKARKLMAVAVGLYDGVRGHLGRFDDRHPRVQAAAAARQAVLTPEQRSLASCCAEHRLEAVADPLEGELPLG